MERFEAMSECVAYWYTRNVGPLPSDWMAREKLFQVSDEGTGPRISRWNVQGVKCPTVDELRAVESEARQWKQAQETDYEVAIPAQTRAVIEGLIAAINAKLGKAQEISPKELKAAIGAKLQAAEASKETAK